MRPHNLPLVLPGAGLLWFGWFGFNAGSALAADGTAAAWRSSTPRSPPAAAAAWILVSSSATAADHPRRRLRRGRRPGRHHPGRGLGQPAGRARDRRRRRGRLLLAVGLKYRLATTTRSTWSACTASAAVGALLIGLLATASVTGGDRKACLRRWVTA